MKTREIVIYGILSAVLLAAQVSLGFLPNIELVTLLLIVYTLVLKKKVFFVIYVFVLLEGMIYGFGLWWINYLYVWSVQAVITLLFRKNDSVWFWSILSGIYLELCAPFHILRSVVFPVHLHIGRQDFCLISFIASAMWLSAWYYSDQFAIF